MDRKFALTALVYGIIGLALGIHMAMTQDHGQKVTHAHIMLLGFVVSFIYALCHKVWIGNSTRLMAVIQFYVHQVGAVVLLAGLFLMYGELVNVATIDPVLGVASVFVLIGLILMAILFAQETREG